MTARNDPAFDGRCLDLRQSGRTYREIADELGCSISTAHHAAERARQAVPEESTAAARSALVAMTSEHYRQLADIAERAIHAASDAREAGDERAEARWLTLARLTVRDLVPVLERLATLQGADRPVPRFVEVKLVDRDALDAHLAELEAELRSRGYDVDSIPSVHDYLPRRLDAPQVVPDGASFANGTGPHDALPGWSPDHGERP